MAFQPSVNQALTIDTIGYVIAEHPARRGEPYGIAGQQAMVYQLVATSSLPDDQAELRRRALKVYPAGAQPPELVAHAGRLAAVAGVPGLAAARRTVLAPERYWNVLRRNPDLMYAIVMPWIDGPTWAEAMQAQRPLTREQSGALASALARALVALEQRGLAHGDLAGANLLLPGLVDGAPPAASPVELVDLEHLYAAGAERPEPLPAGSPGYAHTTALQGLWQPEMDRFAGAVLLAELLGWCDEEVRASAWGASYFDPREVQQSTARYRVLTRVLRERWGERIGWFFERAWLSATVTECAPLAEWLAHMPAPAPPAAAAPPPAPPGPAAAPAPPVGLVRPPVGLVRPPVGPRMPVTPPAPEPSPPPPPPAAAPAVPAPDTPVTSATTATEGAAAAVEDAPSAPDALATTPAMSPAEAGAPAAPPAPLAEPAVPDSAVLAAPPAAAPMPPVDRATLAAADRPRWPRPPVGPPPPAAPPPAVPSPPVAEAAAPSEPDTGAGAVSPVAEAAPAPDRDTAEPGASPDRPPLPAEAAPAAAPSPAGGAAPTAGTAEASAPPAWSPPPVVPPVPAAPPVAPAPPPAMTVAAEPAPSSAPVAPPAPVEDWSAAPPVDEAASAARALLDLAERLEHGGARAAALASYRWALALAPADSALARQIEARLAAW